MLRKRTSNGRYGLVVYAVAKQAKLDGGSPLSQSKATFDGGDASSTPTKTIDGGNASS